MADEEERKSSTSPIVDEMMEMDEESGDDAEEEEEEEEDEEELDLTAVATTVAAAPGPIVLALENHVTASKESLEKPLGIRRRRGRPRKGDPEYTSPTKPLGLKIKRWKSGSYIHDVSKTLLKANKDSLSMEDQCLASTSLSPSPLRESPSELSVRAVLSAMASPTKSSSQSGDAAQTLAIDKSNMPAPDEPPYFPEKWPNKVCALCNLPEKSQLGQGEMLRLICPEGFNPRKSTSSTPTRDGMMSPLQESASSISESERDSPIVNAMAGDRSPRAMVPQSRRKNMKLKYNACANEMLDELGMVGYAEEVDQTNLFEAGNYYVHYGCAVWSAGVTRSSEGALEGVAHAVVDSVTRRCAYPSCGRLGASVACQFAGCPKHFHLPCAAASGGFQCNKTHSYICNLHLDQVPLLGVGVVTCNRCDTLGDVSNLTMCSACGLHYHGKCVGMALLPEVRAGWQCSDCRYCQVCRLKEMDHTKIMVCERCDKAYHPVCQRPIVTTIPKLGWKCKYCRVCTDCGSRTPGAGHSSRWHHYYTVCDSCYQQRNKGFSCPLCKRAYRAAAVRDMVQCTICRKAVHSSCDADADVTAQAQRKRAEPTYEYVCPVCKQITNKLKRKSSMEDMDTSLSGSQDSLIGDDLFSDLDLLSCDRMGSMDDEGVRGFGLGKGKPFHASKIAKKKLGIHPNNLLMNFQYGGRAAGFSRKGIPASSYQKKHQKMAEFGRKRGPKSKMRGVFGVPGLGLQRPQADSSQGKKDDDQEDENRLVLVSAKDKFVLTQDVCVMCGALGQDQEGCLISCAQCGQCYHPYCASVKITKVILQKGWRCLDCTVCEGCGQRNDEARLILCDDCDISYHIYCMDPPLDYVPHGNWKCKWCVQCTTCGANDPGTNCHWLNGFTECGPCGSRAVCPVCQESYSENELIIKCVTCERWLHCACDRIRSESEAEKCAGEGYICLMCRPHHVLPPHLVPPPASMRPKPKPLPALLPSSRLPSPPRSPEISSKKGQEFVRDGVILSECGMSLIKSLEIEKEKRAPSDPKKKRVNRKLLPQTGPLVLPSSGASKVVDPDGVIDGEGGPNKEAGDGDDDQEEPLETLYRDGMVVAPNQDGSRPEPPEGFTIHTSKTGNLVLRRIRVRNLKNLGIGGFNARLRNNRYREENEDPLEPSSSGNITKNDDGAASDEKPKRKPLRRKPRSKLVENYPSYLQEAFFGRDLLDTRKEQASSSSSESEETERSLVTADKTITLSQDELRAIQEVKAKQEKDTEKEKRQRETTEAALVLKSPVKEEDEGSDAEVLKDILHLPKDLLDADLVNTIMNEEDGMKNGDSLDDIAGDALPIADVAGPGHKDEFVDILRTNFNIDCMVPGDTGLPNMNSKDVEEIFKGVLTDESQESQECNVFPISNVPGQVLASHNTNVAVSPSHHPVIPSQLSLARSQAVQSNMPSPMSFPPPSPYQSEYSNSPQFSPAFSETAHSPWVSSTAGEPDGNVVGLPGEGSQPTTTQTKSVRNNSERMEADEPLGKGATISSVLYANINHPEWKKDFPVWSDRVKMIVKKWRVLTTDQKAPYLTLARDNRTNQKMKKGQQICAPGASTSKNPVTLMSSQPLTPTTSAQNGSKPTAGSSASPSASPSALASHPEVCSGGAGPDEELLLTASGVEHAPSSPSPSATPSPVTPSRSPAPIPAPASALPALPLLQPSTPSTPPTPPTATFQSTNIVAPAIPFGTQATVVTSVATNANVVITPNKPLETVTTPQTPTSSLTTVNNTASRIMLSTGLAAISPKMSPAQSPAPSSSPALTVLDGRVPSNSPAPTITASLSNPVLSTHTSPIVTSLVTQLVAPMTTVSASATQIPSSVPIISASLTTNSLVQAASILTSAPSQPAKPIQVNPPPAIPPPHHHHTIHHSPAGDGHSAPTVPTIVRRTPTLENVNLKFLPIQTVGTQGSTTHTLHQYFPVQHIISPSTIARASNAVVVATPTVVDAGPRATIQTASIVGILTTNTVPVQVPLPAGDQQIRVLTPSEIMRTLPSLEPPTSLTSDQEKIHQQKNSREAEQERQWKQLQALRQQQQQQQQHQHQLQAQQTQALQRARQMNPDGTMTQFTADPVGSTQNMITSQLQVTTGQQQFTSGIQSPGAQQRSPVYTPRPNADPYMQAPGTPRPHFPLPHPPTLASPGATGQPYAMAPGTPRPSSADPYAQAPATPRPRMEGEAFATPPSTPTQVIASGPVAGQEGNQQLRDLLQRSQSHQFKKLEPGDGQQRLWAPNVRTEGAATDADNNSNLIPTLSATSPVSVSAASNASPASIPSSAPSPTQLPPTMQQVHGGPPTSVDAQQLQLHQQQQQIQQQQHHQLHLQQGQQSAEFRQPLPPSLARPRFPPHGVVIRQPGVRLPLQPGDPRIMAMDPRTRLLLQQRAQAQLQAQPQLQGQVQSQLSPQIQPQLQQMQQQQQVQPALQSPQPPPQSPTAPQTPPQSQSQLQSPTQAVPISPGPQMQPGVVQFAPQQVQSVTQADPTPPPSHAVQTMSESQEIPESVTAELEKLEQEGNSMPEVDNVNDILGLGDDDDELLAEMGDEFNILEYADPELGDIGEKTNILDENLDLEEPDVKKDSSQREKPDGAEALERSTAVTTTVSSGSPAGPTGSTPQQSNLSIQQQTTVSGANEVNVHPSSNANQVTMVNTSGPGTPTGPNTAPQTIPGTNVQTQSQLVGRMVVDQNGERRLIDGNVAISYQSSFPAQPPLLQRLHMQVPAQRLQQLQRRVVVGQNGQILQHAAASQTVTSAAPCSPGKPGAVASPGQPAQRLGSAPPPPPYPGPPPPYPGSLQHMAPVGGVMSMGPPGLPTPSGPHMRPMPAGPAPGPLSTHMQRRPLLLQDQPLLLEDLLEQEKRELEKQQQQHQQVVSDGNTTPTMTTQIGNNLINDLELQHLHASVLSSGGTTPTTPTNSQIPGQVVMQSPIRPAFPQRQLSTGSTVNAISSIGHIGTVGHNQLAMTQATGIQQTNVQQNSLQQQNLQQAGIQQGIQQPGLQQQVLQQTSIQPGIQQPNIQQPAVQQQQPVLHQTSVQQPGQQQWIQRPQIVRPPMQPAPPPEPRIPLFNAQRIPAPPMPPENIVTDADRQAHILYDQWLNHENQVLTDQLKYYETEVNKLRKARKSLISKKRVATKNGNELPENDALELQRITSEQAGLQKHLDGARKSNKQHNTTMQEYRTKQSKNQQLQQLVVGQQPGQNVQQMNQVGQPMGLMGPSPQQSPLRAPQSSPIHTPQSPSLQQQNSPLVQQHSPMVQQQPSPSPQAMQSPGAMIGAASPGPGSVNTMIQHSPGNPAGMSPHSLQPSPRIGTPHSQGDDSPFSPGGMHPAQSPNQQVCPPPPSPLGHRLASPQHRPQVAMSRQMTVYATNPQQFQSEQVVRMAGMPPRFVRAPSQPNGAGQQIQGNQRMAGPNHIVQTVQRPNAPMVSSPNQISGVNPEQITPEQLAQQQMRQQLIRNQLMQQQHQQAQQQPGLQQQNQLIQQVQSQPQQIVRQVVQVPNGTVVQSLQFQQLTPQQQVMRQQLLRQKLQQTQQIQSGQMQPGQMQPGQMQPVQMQTGQMQSGQMQTGQMQSGQIQTGQMQIGQQMQSGQVQQGQPRLMAPQNQQQGFSQQQQQVLQRQLMQQNVLQDNNSQMQMLQRQQQMQLAQQKRQMMQQQAQAAPQQRQMMQQQQQTPPYQQPPSSPLQQPDRSPSLQAGSPAMVQSPHHILPSSPMSQQGQFGPPQPPSPHLQSASPRPPQSPHLSMGHPPSPMVQTNQSPLPPRSPMVSTQNPLGSPMSVRRPSSTGGGSMASSPVIPDRPLSVENPSTPRTPQEYGSQQDMLAMPQHHGGGGNPNNPQMTLPHLPPGLFGPLGRLGLRGGSPMYSVRQQQQKKPEPEKKTPVIIGCSSSGSNPRITSLVSADYNDSDEDSSTPPITSSTPESDITKSEESRKCEDSDLVSDIVEDGQSIDVASDILASNIALKMGTAVSAITIPKIDAEVPEILLEDDAADSPRVPSPKPDSHTDEIAPATSSNLAEDDEEPDLTSIITGTLTEEEVGMIIGVPKMSDHSSSSFALADSSTRESSPQKTLDKDSVKTDVQTPVNKEVALVKEQAISDTPESPSEKVVNVDPSPFSSAPSTPCTPTVTEAEHLPEQMDISSTKTPDEEKQQEGNHAAAETAQVAESSLTAGQRTVVTSKPAIQYPPLSKLGIVKSEAGVTSAADSATRVTSSQLVRLPVSHVTPALVPVGNVSVITPRVLTPVSSGLVAARSPTARSTGQRVMATVVGSTGYKLTGGNSLVISPRKIQQEDIQSSPCKTSQDAQSSSRRNSPVQVAKQPFLIIRPQGSPLHILHQQSSGTRIAKLVIPAKSQQMQFGPKSVPLLVTTQPQAQQAHSTQALAAQQTHTTQQAAQNAESIRISSPLSEQESINLLEKTTVQIPQPTAESRNFEPLLEAMERIHEDQNIPFSIELQSPSNAETDPEVSQSSLNSQPSCSTAKTPPASADSKSKQTPEPVFEGLGKTLFQVSLSQSDQKSRILVRQAGSSSAQPQSPSAFLSGSPKLASLLGATAEPAKPSVKRELLPELTESAQQEESAGEDANANGPDRERLLSILQDSPAAPESAVALSSATSTPPPPVADTTPTSEAAVPEASCVTTQSERPAAGPTRRPSAQDITITSASDTDSTLTDMTLPPNIRQITSTIYSQSSADKRPPSRPQSQPSSQLSVLRSSPSPRPNLPSHSVSAPGSPVQEQMDAKSEPIRISTIVAQGKTSWNGDKKSETDSTTTPSEQTPVVQGSPIKKSVRSQSTPAMTSKEEEASPVHVKTIVSPPPSKSSLLQAQLMAGVSKAKDDSSPIGPPPPYPFKEKTPDITSTIMPIKTEMIKTEPMDVDEPIPSSSESTFPEFQPKEEKDEMVSKCTSESQNVLLKQLLQNTACATVAASDKSISLPAPLIKDLAHTSKSLPEVPSLEAQLARPVPPTPSPLIFPLLGSDARIRPTTPPTSSRPPRPTSGEPTPSASPLPSSASGTPASSPVTTSQSTTPSTPIVPTVTAENVAIPSTPVTSVSSLIPPASTSNSQVSATNTITTISSQPTPASTPDVVSTSEASSQIVSSAPVSRAPLTSAQSPAIISAPASSTLTSRTMTPPTASVPSTVSSVVAFATESSPVISSVSTPATTCMRQVSPPASGSIQAPPTLPTSNVATSCVQSLSQAPVMTPIKQEPGVVQIRPPVPPPVTSSVGTVSQALRPGAHLAGPSQQQQGMQQGMAQQGIPRGVHVISQAIQQQGMVQGMQQLVQQGVSPQQIGTVVSQGMTQVVHQTVHQVQAGMQQVISHPGMTVGVSNRLQPGAQQGLSLAMVQGAPPQIMNRVGPHGSIPMQPGHPMKADGPECEVPNPVQMPVEMSASEKSAQEQAAIEMKKLKRRQYQQKRRQSQGKETSATAKKRLRKLSKVDEDYDSWMESLMSQLNQLPPVTVLEPQLGRNHAVCCIYGSGDLTKVTSSGCRSGELRGTYGSAALPGVDDHYVTQPYGERPPLPPQPPISTQRGFYDQEFAPLQLDDVDDKKTDYRERDIDTPDTIVSSSSPESVLPDYPLRFPGLRLIDDDLSDEEESWRKRASPIIPIIAPIPVRARAGVPLYKDTPELDKENFGMTRDTLHTKPRTPGYQPLKDSGNVSVTVTLTAAAAEDIAGVLRDLANILRIPAPTSFQVLERTGTPPSHKLGLYRYRSKDGKEAAPIDIQSILNGAAKFCRHCDIVILNNIIKKKVSELAFLKGSDSLLGDAGGDDVYFCSSTCYMQFALMHRSPSISHDKAAAIVDHVCQAPSPPKKSRLSVDDDLNRTKSIDSLSMADSDDVEMQDLETLRDVKVEKESLSTSTTALSKSWKGVRYRLFNNNQLPPPRQKYRKPTERDLTEMLFRMVITVMPQKMPEDTRKCLFCHAIGDGISDGPARLLNLDVDKWVHLNCALWSDEVYETVNGALMNIEQALQQSLTLTCTLCHRTGATLRCFKVRCAAVYHLQCAVKDECVFFKNKTLYCQEHVPKNDKENELTTLSVFRRVYINRDENRQVATVMHHADENHLMRVGSLIFLNVGQLLPHQLQNFHTPNYIYPIGYKIIRFYWSMRVANKRCRYICSIHESEGRPEFRVLVQEPSQEDLELRDSTAKGVWQRILEPMQALRRDNGNVNIFPKYISGEDLFGLNEPAVVRVLESLPGVETLTDYRFKYGRNPLLELPLAVNPTGCARSEPKIRGQITFKRPHTQRTAGTSARPPLVSTPTTAGEVACPYSKQFVHSKSSQYKKMKQDWRNNVYLARSKIAGLGLYATRDIERHTMVIEYIGEIIRSELSEAREKRYQERNRGIYMFRLDEDRVVDATLSGGLARYINHSCNPNCVAETVEVDRDLRIIIFAKRRILRGEELAYDYKFDIEDDQHKIPCLCGAPNCKKWMN